MVISMDYLEPILQPHAEMVVKSFFFYNNLSFTTNHKSFELLKDLGEKHRSYYVFYCY